jgi:hypothetical protein
MVLLAVLTGLVFMHQLAGGADPGGHAHSAHGELAGNTPVDEVHAVVATDPGRHCPPGDGDCPVPHGHPGQMCQLTKPVQQALTAPPPQDATPDTAVSSPLALSPHTAAHDAAGGTGCGPPTLTELSVWRI